jgi:hypothetical protein
MTAVGVERDGGSRASGLLSRPQLVVAGATLVAAVAVLWGLGDRSIWLDEAFTVMHARLPAGEFWELVTDREANAVLHSLVIHLMGGLGEQAWWLRLPSVVSVVALVPTTHLLGRRLFHPKVGAMAAVLVACNGFVVEYGQEGRGYALLMLLSALSGFFLVRLLQEDDRWSWVGWVLVSALLGYAHFFGALVLAAEGLALLVRWFARSSLRTRWTPVLVGGAIVAVAHLPIAAFFAFGGSKGQNGGLPAFTPVRFLGVFVRLAGNFGVPLALLVAVPCVLALLAAWRKRSAFDEQAWGVVLCACGVAVPVLLAAAVSLVDPLFVARYFVEVIPYLAVLSAFGLTQVRTPWLRLGLAAAIVLLGLAAVVSWHAQPDREDAEALAAALAEPGPDGVEPGDVILFEPWFARIPVELQLEDEPAAQDALTPAYPATAWGDWLPTDDPGPVTEDEVAALAAPRVWLVQRRGAEGEEAPVPEEVASGLEDAGYVEAAQQTFDGLTLTRFDRSP